MDWTLVNYLTKTIPIIKSKQCKLFLNSKAVIYVRNTFLIDIIKLQSIQEEGYLIYFKYKKQSYLNFIVTECRDREPIFVIFGFMKYQTIHKWL